MDLLLRGTGMLLAGSLALALLLRGVLWLCRSRPQRFWRRTLWIHVFLVPLHLLVTMPMVMGYFGSRMVVNTRSDERRYAGPRIGSAGNWLRQSRETLAAEAGGSVAVDPKLAADAAQRAVHFESSDGVPLRAFLVAPREQSPRCTAVLVHGLFRGGLELETVGEMFRDLGAEVLLLELRNHGGSGRVPATFGLREAEDVVAAVRWLRARPEHRGRKIVLFGVSLGTAAVALSTERIEDLAGVVLDAPMDELRPTAERMFGSSRARRRGFGVPEPFLSLILTGLELWSGFRLDEVRPGDALRRLEPDVPVLLIGAGADERMPPEQVRALFDELPTVEGRRWLWIREDAEHGRVWTSDPDGYRRHLADFLTAVDNGG